MCAMHTVLSACGAVGRAARARLYAHSAIAVRVASEQGPCCFTPTLLQRRWYAAQPPHQVLGMPSLSPTMSQGNVAKWHVKEGDTVTAGTLLADIETDKATMGFDNQDEGFVAKLLVPEGAQNIPIGQPVLILVEDAESIAAFANYKAEGAPAAKPSAPEQKSAPAPAPASKPAAPSSPAGPSKSYPPHTPLTMPSLSPTMDRGNILSWSVKEGDAIKPGDVIAEIETDKATMSLENQDEGFIAKITKAAGSKDVPVGTPIAIIVEEAESVSAFADYSPDAGSGAGSSSSSSSDASAQAKPTPSSPAPAKESRGPANHRMGPAVRLILASAGLSPGDVTPTGPNNIITKGDVLAAIAAGVKPGSSAAPPQEQPTSTAPAQPAAKPSPPPPATAKAPSKSSPPPPTSASYTDVPNSQMRRIIAQRLLESKTQIPAMYVSADTSLDAVLELRVMLAEKGSKVSINDCVLKAVALALKDVPQANVFWEPASQSSKSFSSIDISVAVSTDKGLITPIVKNADSKSLMQISKEVKELALKARENKLKPDEFQGGSFTVSNLGMYGLSDFSAIINPPQACILAVGGGQQKVVLKDGKPVTTNYMTVTITADHRVYDGALAAAFLRAFCDNMASPVNMLM